MSISVTVSGDESTSVISSQLNTGSITVSGSESIQVTSAGVNSASVTISTGDPVTITGNFSTFVTGSVVRPNEISSFITTSNLSALETATGNLNTRVNSNDSDITSLNAATGVLNTATGALSTATGLLVPKSDTGSFLTSGQIDTNINTAVSNLVDSAPSTLDTLNELAASLGDDANFSTSIATSLGNKANKSETGSFAVTGSDVTFSNLTVTGDILPENNVLSDIGSPSKRFKDLYLSGNSIFLGDSRLSFTTGAAGGLNITGQGTTGRFLQDVETGAILSPLQTATGLLNTATGTLSTATGELNTATGSLSSATGALNTATGSLSSATGSLNTATGTLNTNIGTVSGLITSNDSDISALNTATGLLTGATGALSTATGVLQGVTGSFAQTGTDVNFQNLTVNNNISLSGNIIDLDGNEIIEIQSNDVIFNSKHIQAAFGVGVRHDRGDVRGMDQGSTISDLGIFCNSIEALSIQTGGNVIVNTGNVGIGTESPDTQLHIKSTGDVSLKLEADTDNINENHNPLIQFLQDSGLISANVGFNGNTNTDFTDAIDNAFYIENTSSAAGFGAIQFASNNQAQLTILSGGNVGIGTNSPEAKLDVSHSSFAGTYARFSRGTTNIDFDLSASSASISSTVKQLHFGPSDGQPLVLKTSGSERARIDEIGNFGIGTNSPQAKLHVSGDTIMSGGNLQIGSTPAYSPTRAIKIHDNGVQFGARVTLVGTNDNGGPGLEMVTDGSLSKRTIIRHEGEGSNDYGLAFFTTDNGTTSEKVRFDGNGGVGIGTSSVTAGHKLDVNGDIKATNINASEVDAAGGDGYKIENKQFAKFESNILKFGDHDDETFVTALYSNGGFETVRITGQKVGIGNTSPTEALDVSGNILSNGVIKAFNNTQNVAQLEVGRDNNQYLEMKVSDPDCFITANQDSDSNGNHHFVLDRVFAGTGANDFEIRKGGTAQVTVDASGYVGIGTTTPSAPLHVVGSGIITDDFAVDTNTLFVDASANNVGIRTLSPRALTALHVNDDLLVTNGNEDHFNVQTTNYIYKLGDISGGDNQSHLEINSPNAASIFHACNVGMEGSSTNFFATTPPQATLHVNGTAIVSGGLTTLGKTTLSSHAFVTETGSFTLSNTHKGATVLLQNSASINITVPAQVSGYVTTFIAETHNPVSFITGAGMSGLNSFNGASDIAGIYGQAQVIFKSAEYAFLGGNVV